MFASTVLLSLVMAQQIVIDGKTQTTLNTNGNVTDFRTQTISGANAYNSFKKFNVDKGNTVNLHLPGSTKTLVNLIYDEKSNINGILNSIKNGSILDGSTYEGANVKGEYIALKSQYGIFSNIPYSNIDIIGNNVYLDAGTSIGTYNDPPGVKNKGHIKVLSYKDKYITTF